MYDEVYKELVIGGIASKLLAVTEDAIWFNKKGEMIHETKDTFGLPATHYIMKQPGKLIFVDKVGSNTNNQKMATVVVRSFFGK